MDQRSWIARVCALVACLLPLTATAEAEYRVAPPAAWVDRTFPTPYPAAPPATGKIVGGVEYLLLDRQIRIDGPLRQYRRFVTRVTNSAGVESEGQHTIEFDPTREQVTLHGVTVLRAGTVYDQLQQGRIAMLRRETDLERNIVDGWHTLAITMSDLRIGDVVDVAYTVDRREPAWGDRYWAHHQAQWASPLRESRLLVTHPADRALNVLLTGVPEPTRTASGAWQTLEWRWRDVPPLTAEGDRPSWHTTYPSIQLSEYAGWGEVVARSLPLYEIPAQRSPEFTALVERFRALPSNAARARAVLRFVQDEVRYTGVFVGVGAYRPRPPGEVLARRFGDCKEKTLLAKALLAALDIESTPALVSTDWRERTGSRLPSPGVFDHVILNFVVDGRPYWADLTVTGQGGSLAAFVQADFGQALPIAPGVDALVAMPRVVPTSAESVVRATLDASAGVAVPAMLKVVSRYRGSEADEWRRSLLTKSLEELGDEYLDYYRTIYPKVEALAPPTARDDRESNEVVITESYRIPDAFEKLDDGDRQLTTIADNVISYVRGAQSPVRRSPLAITHPKYVEQTIDVRLPEPWNIEAATEKISAPGFEYTSRVVPRAKGATLHYAYRTTRDHVDPKDLPAYVKKRAAAYDDTDYFFTWSDEPGEPEWLGPVRTIARGLIVAGLVYYVVVAVRRFARRRAARAQ